MVSSKIKLIADGNGVVRPVIIGKGMAMGTLEGDDGLFLNEAAVRPGKDQDVRRSMFLQGSCC